MVNIFDQWLVGNAGDLRLLSAIGIIVHWWILQYTIGLLTMVFIVELVGRRKNDEQLLKMAKSMSKIVAVNFAIGAATGSMSEFGLVIFWPNLLRIVGKFFFVPLYLEIFAFLAEVVFVYMYHYTWDRVDPKLHLTIGFFAALGSIISALMIVSVNALMNYPIGLHPTYNPYGNGAWTAPYFTLIDQNGNTVKYVPDGNNPVPPANLDQLLESTVSYYGIWGLLFSWPAIVSFLHAVGAAITVTSFTLLGIYAYRYLTPRNDEEKEYYMKGIRFQSLFALIIISIQGFIFGHMSGTDVAHYTPEKLAAMEGTTNQFFTFGKIIPTEPLIAFLSYGSFKAKIMNYDTIPEGFRPPIIIHYLYNIKIGTALLLGVDAVILVLYFYILKKQLPTWFIKLQVLTPFAANLVATFGWMVREIGRKPFTVYGLMTSEQAATTQPVSWILIALVIIYVVSLGAITLILDYKIGKRK